jgi:hypothetical protein
MVVTLKDFCFDNGDLIQPKVIWLTRSMASVKTAVLCSADIDRGDATGSATVSDVPEAEIHYDTKQSFARSHRGGRICKGPSARKTEDFNSVFH